MYFVIRIGTPGLASNEKTTLLTSSAEISLFEDHGPLVSTTWSTAQPRVILLFRVT